MDVNRDTNLAMLGVVAERLGSLREKVVFLGGCTTGLLLTDPGASDVRATMDVDLIAEAATSLEFHDIETAMRDRGFQPDVGSGIQCRWRSGDIMVDLMPDDESILGFSNRWYRAAITHAVEERLIDGTTIRRVTAPYFVATKIEAFNGRAGGDFTASHDFEDIVTVIDGREELHAEIVESEATLRRFIAGTFRQWWEDTDLSIALAGQLLPDQESQNRYEILERRFLAIASIDQ